MKTSSVIFSVLVVLLVVICPCNGQADDIYPDPVVADGFDQMLLIVKRKNNEQLQYLGSQQVLLEINKSKLQSSRYISISPSVTRSGEGKLFPVVTGYVNVNDYIGEFSVVPFENEYNNYFKFMIPFFNNRKKKIALIADMIDLTIKKSNYEIEMSLFYGIQNLLTSCIQLKKIRDEIQLRDTLSKKSESIIALLKNLQECGIIPHRALRGIEYLKADNNLSIDVLYRRIAVNENRLMDENIMSKIEIEQLEKILPKVFSHILELQNKETVDNISYSEQLSRIDREILDINIRLNSMQNVMVSAGPTINSDGGFTKIAPGLAAGLTVELSPKKSVLIEKSHNNMELIRRRDIPRSTIDSTAQLQIVTAEKIIGNCIEEMSLGNINSMYSLTELLNDVLNQQLNLLSLHYEEIESRILSFKKIADFGITSHFQQVQQ